LLNALAPVSRYGFAPQSLPEQLTHFIRKPPYLPTFQIAAFISTYFNTSMRNQPMKPVTIMQTIISGIKK
jgi:hypothetical protein